MSGPVAHCLGPPAARKRERAPAGALYPGPDPGGRNSTEDKTPEGALQSGSPPDHQIPDLAHVLHRKAHAFAAQA
jgi:hypothetical protein